MSAPAPAGGPPGYRARLDEALQRYRRVAGRAPGPEALDPSRPEVQRAYRAFAGGAPPLAFRPGLGEELALRLGLKPVLRLLTAPAGVEALAAHFRRGGFQTLAGAARHVESRVDGLITPAVADGAGGRVLLYAGRRAEELAEAAALDGAMLRPAEGGRADPGARAQGAAASRRLGALLGYPPCCCEAFAARWPACDNAGLIADAAARTARFDARLDNLVLSACHLAGWFPCRYDCQASLEVAAAVDAALAALDPPGAAGLRRFLRMPRLYLDERRLLILDGDLEGPARIRLRAVHTPYAFDRAADEAAYEWVFFADVAAPLLEGGTLTVTPDALVLERPGRAPCAWSRPPGSTWLPFEATREP